MPSPRAEIWSRVHCVQGDLTRETTAGIVNAANGSLQGGGGVDGAIHRAAGPELAAECRRLYPDGCPTGQVRLTRGFRLPARNVIHAVGPVWHGGARGEAELLAACYERALDLAAREGLTTIAFPAISCGAYGYPWPLAAQTAFAAIGRALERHAGIGSVRVVLFGPEIHAVFARELARRAAAR